MTRPSKSLFNLNRCLILLFVVLGQLSDGIQTGDYFFFAATVLWIWLPSCVRLETTVINYVAHHGDSNGSEPAPKSNKHQPNPERVNSIH